MNGKGPKEDPQEDLDEECLFCIFHPDKTCEDCRDNGFYRRVMISNFADFIKDKQKKES